MSMECAECERDARSEHDEWCSRHPINKLLAPRGYAPGAERRCCSSCESDFKGGKRATVCMSCAAFDTLKAAEKAEAALKRALRVVRAAQAYYDSDTLDLGLTREDLAEALSSLEP